MKNSTHTPLRASERRKQQQLKLRHQTRLRSYLMLLIVVAACLLDVTLLHSGLLIAKGVTLGVVINWFAQTLFAWFVFRYTRIQSQKTIVGRMFIGQVIKWVVVITGFGVVLGIMTSIPAGAVITGFIAMQLAHFISLWQWRG